MKLIPMIEVLGKWKVQAIRSDNGTEFRNHIFNSFCEQRGILRQFNAARTPQQNGLAERKNRTLVEAARTMLIESKLPIIFWAEVVNCAAYVLNRSFNLPNSGDDDIIPHTQVTIINPQPQPPSQPQPSVTQLPPTTFDIPPPPPPPTDSIPPLDIPSSTSIPTSPTDTIPPPTSNFPSQPSNQASSSQSNPMFLNTNFKTLKDHPHDYIIGSITDGVRTRSQSGLINECIYAAFLSQWVFRNKPYDRGVVIRNKARLVVQGFAQEEWIDYTEVFALVARLEAIRIFLAHAANKDFKVYQMDVRCAFLYGDIDEEIYIWLHQAPRIWYETLTQYLLSKGVSRGTIDMTLFKKEVNGELLIVQVYVDDIIFGSTNEGLCREFEKVMIDRFEMTIMGEMCFFLGLQVEQKPDGILIHQEKYIKEILTKFGIDDSSPELIPFTAQTCRTSDDNGNPVEAHRYRSMIGSFMYLTTSRPDITFAVCCCARFQANPKESHEKAVKRIFRYLKGSSRLGLWYPKGGNFDLHAFSDSDHASCRINRKSVTGGCQYLGECLVSWQSKKQTTVSLSTGEAEYIDASSCCCQVLWIQHQMMDYGINFLHTPLFYDNEAAVGIAKNPVHHTRTKHIETRIHAIREAQEKGFINIIPIETRKQKADHLTNHAQPENKVNSDCVAKHKVQELGNEDYLLDMIGLHKVTSPVKNGLRASNLCLDFPEICQITHTLALN
ncbi:hypothetical protein QVD17_16572 [Tagetes erecta]|uniref:Integrase catalytic domain-containing protein n=1 Tax=Tagetes erecta TaxID=13708 RepID=A0AAD8KR48_TARER|nr:hypothetical protein QVD17_16572 [Tagetes erecta]